MATSERYEVEYRFKRATDNAYRWHLERALPLQAPDGQVVKWFGTSTDIDDQKRAEQTLRFLAKVSALLASSLDYETTLASVAGLALPALADYCLVDVVEENGQICRVATVHTDPDKVDLVHQLRRYPRIPTVWRKLPRFYGPASRRLYLKSHNNCLKRPPRMLST